MILVLPPLHRAALEPGDLLDLLAARAGHAFLPETQRPFAWGFQKTAPDEVVLTNWARNRWDLAVAKKGGAARARTLPRHGLFNPSPKVTEDGDTPPIRPRRRWLAREGALATVAEILAAGKIPLARCHRAYRDRRLLVRFDPDRLEAGLPDLAVAVGARYDEKARALDFDPRAFRDHVRNSIPDSVFDSPNRATLGAGLIRIGILNASDAELMELFSKHVNASIFGVTSRSRKEREAVDRYIAAVLKIMRESGGEGYDRLRALVDFTTPPSIKVVTTGTGRIHYIGRDGKTKVGF